MNEVVQRLRLMLAISWRADRARSVATILTAVGQNASMPVRALGIKVFADGVADRRLSHAMWGVVIVISLSAVNSLSTWWSMSFRMRLRENTQLYLDTYLMELTAGLPGLEHHELPEYLDRLELIRRERHYLANPFNPISWTVASVVATGSAVVLLATVHPVLVLLPLAALPAAIATGRFEQEQVDLMERQAESSRVLGHLGELAIQPGPAKELRVFELGQEVLARHQSLYESLERDRLRVVVRRTAKMAGGWVLFAAAYAGAIAYTAHLAHAGTLTVGAVVLVLSLGGQMNQVLSELAWNVSWLVQSQRASGRLLWLTRYARTSATPGAHVGDVPATLREGIELHNVSFAYPGSDRGALTDLTLMLPAGSTVAIVGENGAGKTTLVKLLTRMYEPSGGTITVDGQHLSSFSIESWRERISAGFQDFAQLELLARESIGVGDSPRIHDDAALQSALGRGAATGVVERLPHGLDHQLGRRFDGAELSIGQWQKLALGRAMMRSSPLLLVLDEPTASLDAPTEHALFEQFAGAARAVASVSGGITILVSHRFSTVRMADLIVVIAEGRVLEIGSHAQLMRQDGAYAELYAMQARSYQ
jgi:ATP-binding cassette subfamily B protein